ncbi:phosphopeptide-binding protein, partial [Fulvivirga sp. RKSG066]|nr:phosphopeptide-binding protein [Fulvivirga aurantia]
TLSPEGNKVRATINGEEFMIDEWAPHQIEGLPIGEVTVKLELLGENGQLVSSPFNPVERKVTLEQ